MLFLMDALLLTLHLPRLLHLLRLADGCAG